MKIEIQLGSRGKFDFGVTSTWPRTAEGHTNHVPQQQDSNLHSLDYKERIGTVNLLPGLKQVSAMLSFRKIFGIFC